MLVSARACCWSVGGRWTDCLEAEFVDERFEGVGHGFCGIWVYYKDGAREAPAYGCHIGYLVCLSCLWKYTALCSCPDLDIRMCVGEVSEQKL